MRADDRLHVAFLWHMHQPYYKDPLTGTYKLPWARLHGVKDYFDMASILREFPNLRQNFNLVPSLLEQLADYSDGAKDTFLLASEKPASSLGEDDRVFILENFFFANWDNMIKPLPRYYDLLKKRGLRRPSSEIKDAARYFSEADMRDLQVLFNLAWIDPHLRGEDPALRGLEQKGKDFTEEEKGIVLLKQTEIIKKIIPEYRSLWDSGTIELSASPYYHPILPLLFDTDSAKEALPDIKLPKGRFSHPEDGVRQIRDSLDYFEKTFGRRPSGMWPSEGSVSEAVLKALKEEGIKWVATDEEVLASSLGRSLRNGSGHVSDPSVLYKAYGYSGVRMVFRDHGLSDLIGFVYSGWDPKDAARNMVENLLSIRRSLPGDKDKGLVSVILDGENAWEYYKNDGRDFLLYLYDGLSKEEALRTVTISEHISEDPDGEELKGLRAGSWIYGNFRTWIGHEEDNLSWDYLSDARSRLEGFSTQDPGRDLGAAWRSLYIAEGSDWNWWYGDEHVTELQKEFDELYRANLLAVYKEIGAEPPDYLHVPILLEDRAVAPTALIRGFITPTVDGLVTGFFEWYQAASLKVGKSGGSMHKAESLVSELYYGFDAENLYLRVDPKVPFKDFPQGSKISVAFMRPKEIRLDSPVSGPGAAEVFEKAGEAWVKTDGAPANSAAGDIFEAGVAFSLLGAKAGDEVNVCVSINKDSQEIERCPWRGYISITVPTPDFEERMWY